MLTPEPSAPISFSLFIVIMVSYGVGIYFAIKYFSKNKNSGHAENL